MLEVLHSKDYIRTARAKGLSQRVVVYVHAFRNAMVPVTTVIGITMAILIGGAVVTEIVFNIPGLGRLIISAILRRDYPVVQGVVLVTAAAYVLINLAVDMLYALMDPGSAMSERVAKTFRLTVPTPARRQNPVAGQAWHGASCVIPTSSSGR